MRILGLVPARGGSKGVPRKNIRLLAGRPLLAYTADAALAATTLARIVVSTEDEETADVARACGLEVPFLRPADLAADDTPTLPVVQHVVRRLETDGDRFDAVCLLQPTNPFRTPALIDACNRRFEEARPDCVVTVVPVPAEHNPHWVYFRDSEGRLTLSTGERTPVARRQDLPPAFHRDGSVYVSGRGVVLAGSLYGDRVVGVDVDPGESVNIDTEDDWREAEQRLMRGSEVATVTETAVDARR